MSPPKKAAQRLSFAAAIFDMDGLLFDTESIARWAWQEALKSHGYIMEDELYFQFVGRDLKWREKILKQKYGADFPFDSVVLQRIEIGDTRELQEGLPTKSDVIELLTQLKTMGILMALATGTDRKRAIRRLQNAHIYHHFHIIVTSEDVAQGKPEPDIFLAASQKMQIKPEQCLVFEDSCVGVQAAHQAGMRAIMIPDIEIPSAEIRQLAYKVLHSLGDFQQLLPELCC